jgi:hypothetical protein
MSRALGKLKSSKPQSCRGSSRCRQREMIYEKSSGAGAGKGSKAARGRRTRHLKEVGRWRSGKNAPTEMQKKRGPGWDMRNTRARCVLYAAGPFFPDDQRRAAPIDPSRTSLSRVATLRATFPPLLNAFLFPFLP